MSTYRRASLAAWYQDNYPGAVIKPNVGVLHTTETTVLPGYGGGATAPNYTAVPDFKAKRLRWFAHFPDERSSRALRNLPGGVETNTLNALQVELVGTCDPATAARWRKAGVAFIFWPEAPDWALRDLAHFILDQNVRNGIAIQGPSRERWMGYPASYGQRNPNRFSLARWRDFYGWCGHQHVPENDHGDPGGLDWPRLELMARTMLVSPVAAPPEPRKMTPRWDAIYQAAVAQEKALGTRKAPARRKALAAIKERAARWSVRF